MVQMPSNTDVSDPLLVFHQVLKIPSGIVSLKPFIKIKLFKINFGNNRRLKGLSIFLFNEDFGFRVHLFMCLVVLFVLMKNDSVLV